MLFGSTSVPLIALAAGSPPAAQATKLGALGDQIWEKGFGGGPPDLFYPDSWEGTWLCSSTLTKVDLPMGPEFVPNMAAVNRAMQNDLNQTIQYQVRFIRNASGRVISDRAFNTAALVQLYMGNIEGMMNRIDWDRDDPNILSLRLPQGLNVRTRVTRRSQENDDGVRRLETSEFFEQIFDDPNSLQPRIKASQCFTKYIYRSAAEAKGGPEIVATQTVGDFLSAYDTQTMSNMQVVQNLNKPITIYVYRMSFQRQQA